MPRAEGSARGFRALFVRTFLERAVGATFSAIFSSSAFSAATRTWSALNGVHIQVTLALGAAFGLAVLVIPQVRLHGSAPEHDYTYPKVNFDYLVLSKTIRYEVGHDGLLRYSKTIRLRALRDRVHEYADYYAWTGRADVTEPTVEPVDTKILQVGYQTGTPNSYRVAFPSALDKGDEFEFTVRWIGIREWQTARPFISTFTSTPTKFLRLEVQIPPRFVNGGYATYEIPRPGDPIKNFEERQVAFNMTGGTAWEIEHPPLYRTFRIRWTWLAQAERLPS